MASGAANLPRLITVGALVVVAAISWALLARSAAAMSAMSGQGLLVDVAFAMMRPADTTPYLLVTTLMWMVMMSAMMMPAVLPVVLLFQRLERRSGAHKNDGALFASGYLIVWLVFAVVATGVQFGLHRAALLHAHELATGPLLGGVLLLLAGVYQLTSLKLACLRSCQAPLPFLLGHWEEGRMGALRMGVRHGLFCLGCCWALMLLMFAGGVMSLGAMAVLSVFVLAERVAPQGPWIARLPGAVLIVWGAWTLARA